MSSPVGARASTHLDRAERLADRADLPEPGIPGEVIGAGKRHRRRRREPGAQLDLASSGEPGGRLVRIDGDPHAAGQRCIVRRQGKANRSAARRGVRPFRHGPATETTSGDPAAPRRPDRRAARRSRSQSPSPGQNRPSARPARPLPASRPARNSAAPRQMTAAHCRGPPKENHAAMPVPRPTTSHGGSWARSASSRLSSRSFHALKRAFQ